AQDRQDLRNRHAVQEEGRADRPIDDRPGPRARARRRGGGRRGGLNLGDAGRSRLRPGPGLLPLPAVAGGRVRALVPGPIVESGVSPDRLSSDRDQVLDDSIERRHRERQMTLIAVQIEFSSKFWLSTKSRPKSAA